MPLIDLNRWQWFLLCETKWKKVLSTLAIDWAPMILPHTINFASLVKETILPHHPELGPIDSAKNSATVFIHSYKNDQFQYDMTFNLLHLFKNWVEKNGSWICNSFQLCIHLLAFPKKKDRRFTFCKKKKKRQKTFSGIVGRKDFIQFDFLGWGIFWPYKWGNPTVSIINTTEKLLAHLPSCYWEMEGF